MYQHVSKLMKFAAGVAVFGAILSLTAGEANAQVRAALTKNVDEPGRAPFQQMVIDEAQSVLSGFGNNVNLQLHLALGVQVSGG